MTKQTQRFIKGTLILSIAGILSKVVSAFYKIPLEFLTGTVGLSLYQSIYPLYSLLTAASLVGIPNSVSKLVAEEIERKEFRKAHDTFRYAFIITATIGLIVSIILIGFANQIIALANWEKESYYVLFGMGLAPFFIAVAGAVRGYLQGMQIMVPTAISQVIENLFKVFVGIGMVVLLLKLGYPIPIAVGGAAFGASVGFALSALFLLITYRKKRQEIVKRIDPDHKTYRFRNIAKKIAMIAVPITLASSALSIMLLIDSLSLPKILTEQVLVEGFMETEGNFINGILGKVQAIINVPLIISVSLVISIVPSVSAANTKAVKTELKQKIIEGIEIAMKLGAPATVGLFVLAVPVMNFVFHEPEGAAYMELMAIALTFMILGQSLIGILQGLSRYYAAVVIVAISALIKVIINVIAMNSDLGGLGSVVGTIFFYGTITIASYYLIKHTVDLRIDVVHTFLKPILASLIMGVVVFFGYKIIHSILPSNAVATLGSVLIGALVYFVVMVFMKAFREDEIMILPKHTLIIERMRQGNLLKKEGSYERK